MPGGAHLVVVWKHRRDLSTHESHFLLRDLVDRPRAGVEGVVGGIFPWELPLPCLERSLLGFVRRQYLLVDSQVLPSDGYKELQDKQHVFTGIM